MKTWQTLTVTVLSLALLAFLAGCEGEDLAATDQVGVDDFENIDFSQEYGGLTPTDEEEAFGDPYLVEMAAREGQEESDDPLLDDPEVIALEEMASTEPDDDPDRPTSPRFTFVKITWGMLDGEVDFMGRAVDTGDILDWTGDLHVDRGIVLVRRMIMFERPVDHLWPRTERASVAWASHTGEHYDGLLIEIIERPQDLVAPDGSPRPPNRLTFNTVPYSTEFVVADLPDMDQVFEVEPAGNAIHFTGFRLQDIAECPKGFLGGMWVANLDGQGGYFKGRWVGLFGHLHGFMRGAYGVNDEGQRVFVGKYITRNGRFRGLLRGSWEPNAELSGHGNFRGQWLNAAQTVEGVLGGQYYSPPTRPSGFFAGRWATLCDEGAVDSIE